MRIRVELTAAETSLWHSLIAVNSQLLAAWNAFVVQTLGEMLLDADYRADPGTVGFVPPVTYDARTSRRCPAAPGSTRGA